MGFIIIFLSVVIIITLLLLLIVPEESENRPEFFDIQSRWKKLQEIKDSRKINTVSNNVVLAMSQRSVYKLGGTYINESWVKNLMDTSCSKLNICQQYIDQAENIINKFTKKVLKNIDDYQKKMFEFSEQLKYLSDAREIIEKNIFKQQYNIIAELKKSEDKTDDSKYDFRSSLTSLECLNLSQDDDMLTVFDEFIEENLVQIINKQMDPSELKTEEVVSMHSFRENVEEKGTTNEENENIEYKVNET